MSGSGLATLIYCEQVCGQKDLSTPIGWNISSDRQQLISLFMVFGAFLASSATGLLSKFIGPKFSLRVACIAVFVSTAIMQATTTIAGIYAGRLILDMADGVLMPHPLLSDRTQGNSPGKYRGLGTLVGSIVNNFPAKLPTRNAHIIPLGIVHIVPGVLFVDLFFVPESPRRLAGNGQLDKAEKSLKWLRLQTWSVTEGLTEMESALAAERELQGSIGFLGLFSNPIDRCRKVVAVLGLITQAASGAGYIISLFHMACFFEMAQVGNTFENQTILNGVAVFALLVKSALTPRYGYARIMMPIGFTFVGITHLIIAIVYTLHPGTSDTGKAIVVMTVTYIAAYNAMIAPNGWLCGGELPSQQLRAYTVGLVTAIGFFIACVITLVWIYFYLPEAKGRTFEEINEMFEARVPARKFRKYRCTGTHAILNKKMDVDKPHVSHGEGNASSQATPQWAFTSPKLEASGNATCLQFVRSPVI
ncbi:MFS general substrate transporter [Zopfia rhizophila CBS 207.26]|uniref:MFS general substrate transporter n=1 Tax=Zopfia rhizophila CBS 207.26 TaxID=1314779 RepID=A0A6A6ESB7_9PEZI|nr:MFS general substrate transporter [Zopfia rhizophila CBS 207.26]